MVSARLTVVPQMALISSGSSEGAAGAERLVAALDIGTSRWVPSELRLSRSVFLTGCRRDRGADAVGVMVKDEWMSPRRFLGVFVTNGLLRLGSLACLPGTCKVKVFVRSQACVTNSPFRQFIRQRLLSPNESEGGRTRVPAERPKRWIAR